MKILINRGCCKIIFEENEKFSGRTLLIDGEGNLEGEFCIYKSLIHKMCWTSPSDIDTKRFVYVDTELRDEVLCYVMEEATKQGLSLVVW